MDFSIFKGMLITNNKGDMAKILQCVSYKVCFIFLLKFVTFPLFVLIMGQSTFILQTPCCQLWRHQNSFILSHLKHFKEPIRTRLCWCYQTYFNENTRCHLTTGIYIKIWHDFAGKNIIDWWCMAHLHSDYLDVPIFIGNIWEIRTARVQPP